MFEIVPVKNFYYKTNIFQKLVVLNKFMQLPMIIFAKAVFFNSFCFTLTFLCVRYQQLYKLKKLDKHKILYNQ